MSPLRRIRCSLVIVLAACNSVVGAEPESRTLVLREQHLVLEPGDSTTLSLALLGAFAPQLTRAAGIPESWPSAQPIRWLARNTDVATVDPSGVVWARSTGETVIVAEVDGLRDSTRVAVIASAAGARFVQVGAGRAHSCGLDVAGRIACWGSRWSGETGDGVVQSHTLAVSPVPIASSTLFTRLAVGDLHSCGLTSQGVAVCWGDNAFGQVSISAGRSTGVPTTVASNVAFDTVAAGSDHTCALTRTGTIVCWGRGVRLEDEVRSPDADRFVDITAGANHRCARTSVGRAYCWGANRFGQTGTGTTVDLPQPTEVVGARRWIALSAGTDYTCGIATDSLAYCWGFGFGGRLGTGAENMTSLPLRVESDIRFATIDAGTLHTCAVNAAGAAYCWGQEFTGALGDGPPLTADPSASDLTQLRPVRVSSLGALRTISAGAGDHTCALDVDTAVYCWGSNRTGALGVGRLGWSPGYTQSVRHSPTATRPVSRFILSPK